MYDAEGTGGIINIILKKVTAQGINGSLSLTGGSRLQNGSFNLAARKGKFAVNAFLSGNAQLTSTTINTLDRESVDPTTGYKSSLVQNGTSQFSRNGYQTGLGFDWAMTEKDNLTGGFSFNDFGNSNPATTNRESITRDASGNALSDIVNLVNANSNFNTKAYDWNVSYKRKFKKKDRLLDILYSSSLADNYSFYQQTQSYVNPDSVFNSSYGKNPGTYLQTNISANYADPITDKILFETGLKTVIYNINSTSDVFLLNPGSDNYNYNSSQSNTINYQRYIYAGYVSTTIKLKFLDIKAGLRNEYTQTNASFSNTNQVNIAPYNIVVPSGIVSHTFKNNQTLKISYSFRIQRPDYNDVNPFVNASDPKNLTTGNPNLKPETSNNIELGYSKSYEKGININVNAFYRDNRADIQGYSVVYPSYKVGDSTYTNVSVTTRENIGREDNIGLNVFASANLKKKFNFRTNLSAYQRYIYSSIVPGSNINGFNYRANLNVSYQITETMIAEVFGNFNSPRISVQGKMPSFTTYNLAIRKQFYHKKMSLALTATNPFNKYVNQRTETTGVDFTSNALRQLPYRSFGINFTWKFGKLEFKKQKEMEDVNLTNPPAGGS
jgi:ferric enterobactin receptor